jgi:NitT/TauT family transport system permease protein
MRRIWSDLFLILLAICMAIGFASYLKQFFGPYREHADIHLSLWNLPQYTFFSMARGLSAYILSLIFSLLVGFWAAKDKIAEKVLIPLLDVLQSIPFLGFLPGIVLLLIGIFKHTNIGLELAAIILIFTAQVWNMAFGVYHSIRTVPIEKNECATAYHFSHSERFRWVELPFAVLSLIWNSIMSMAGGWFLLMVNEAFRLGDRDFRLPGLGSYMSVAASEGDVMAMINAMIAMIVLIVFLDQLLWRPLVVWSQKIRIEETSPAPAVLAESWFLNLIKSSHCFAFFKAIFHHFVEIIQNRKAKNPKKLDLNFLSSSLGSIALFIPFALLIAAAFFGGKLLKDISVEQWLFLAKMLLLTFVRVFICVTISVLIMLPLGLAIGLSEKWSRTLQPILQTVASFPATLLFPALIFLFKLVGVPLGMGSIILMSLGTQWYILFNVMAGVKAMPSDLREAARSFRFNRIQRFLWLHFPAVFPYLITGILSASGGAWNASVVSEYVTYKDQVWSISGIGSTINLAAQNQDYPLLAGSIFVMILVVVFINFQVWMRLYHYSEKRFALNV